MPAMLTTQDRQFPVEWPLPGQSPQDFRVLVVDDQEIVRVALLRMLRKFGFQCLEASDAGTGLELLRHETVHLILSDIQMPGMNGVELVKTVAPRIPDMGVLMVTGMDDLDLAMECLRHGAYGYVLKPAQTNSILIAVTNALRRRWLELEHRDREAILAQKVREQTVEIRASREEIALRLITASEHRDNETGAHVRRIGLYAAEMGRILGWNEDQIECIRAAAPMHDIGKIGVPDRILQKGGPLTPEEWVIMRTHTVMGANILKESTVPFIQMGARIALGHHERWDGSGYPNGIRADAIPLEARITTLVDVYDALSSKRPYKHPWTEEEVLDNLREHSGHHFDPRLVDLFFAHFAQFRQILIAHPDRYPEADPTEM